MIKVSYLARLYINIAEETKAYAATTARKQNDLILSVFWNAESGDVPITEKIVWKAWEGPTF
ncbi:MAG TPA: hypothetical protein VIJ38_15765 [Acidobacteriaceae bacterium]